MINKYLEKEQILKLRESGRIVAQVHKRISEIIKPGVSLKEIEKVTNEVLEENGAKASFFGYGGFPSSICASVNEVILHGIPNDYKIKDGDIVTIDVGAYKDGFHGDAAKTYLVGDVSEETKRLSEATKKALERAISISKPGATIGDIGNIIETTAEEFGFKVTRDFVGHGVGKDLHEEPSVPCFGKKGEGEILEEGMVIAIEPMFIIGTEETFIDPLDNWTVRSTNGKNTSHDEHTILITRKGNEILTK